MSTPSSSSRSWIKNPVFWLGWLAGGSSASCAYSLTLFRAAHIHSEWADNAAFAVTILPTVVGITLIAREQRRAARIRNKVDR